MDRNPHHTQSYLAPPSAETFLGRAQAWTTPGMDHSLEQGFSSPVVVFGEGAKCAKSLCPSALTYDRVVNMDPVRALEILVGRLQPPRPQRSCAVTLPAGMCLPSYLTHGREGAVSRKSFSLGGLFLRSKSLLHITDLQSSQQQF